MINLVFFKGMVTIMNQFFSILSRMKYINRWSLMRNSCPENISVHSLEVAFFAQALAIISNVRYNNNLNPERVAVLAMFHDTSEILTGDLPTPIKYYNSDLSLAYKDLESVANKKLISFLPEDLKGEYEKVYSENFCNEYEKKLLKAADKLSALAKCIEEEEMGNKDFIPAKNATLKALKEYDLPEVKDFLRDFIPSFGLSLDHHFLSE